jgi:anion-transporting  ArsA/GET3 family ATPase
MAAEKLYELHEESDFELVVVDTPPTRNALDFLDAPQRLTRFLDHRLYRILMAPTRAYLKALNVAAQAFLRTVSRVVGGEVVADAVAFFQAFDGMEAGFRSRAAHVTRLLESPGTAYVLVASPRRETVEEASFFASKLFENGLTIAALIVNRVHPAFDGDPGTGGDDPRAVRERAAEHAGTPLGALWANLADFRAVAAREQDQVQDLADQVAPAPLVTVPVLRSDVHDLAGLGEIAAHLFGTPAPAPDVSPESVQAPPPAAAAGPGARPAPDPAQETDAAAR